MLPRRPFLIVGAVVLVAGVAAVAAPRFLEARHQDDLVAVRLLIESIDLPAPAVEGCEDGSGQRCWTTPREGLASIEGFVGVLGAAGVTDLTEWCVAPVPQLTVPSCYVTGWYRGEVVMIASDPTVFIGPPLHSQGATISLTA
ncbi:hypothetical protein [Pengzhenrongella phosphoraccumulans]|uniref:hypothetical protein n=1 Tax=Pengzhenrongella phosphoraccumulans TaxID=3114394 RepID=UPI00388E6453